MKIGTFVGQQFITLNENEIAQIEKNLQESVDETLASKICHTKAETSVYGHTITIKLKPSHVMRSQNGDCFIPRYIRVYAGKSKGYDEAKCGVFYKWPKGYKPTLDLTSYDVNIDLMGDFRGYHKRTIECGVGITQTTYKYGTELSDIDVKEGINKIAAYLRSSRPASVTF